MSYDHTDEEPEPRCARCGHRRNQHWYIGQHGYRLGDVLGNLFGRCKAKKCHCVSYVEVPNET